MTRWKAASIHFIISFAVLGTIIGLVIWRWYPPSLFGMAKAGPLLATLSVVDLVLGPLLTLIVYKAGKRSLKFDLTVIALLQVAALAFGLWTLWQSRPVYFVAIEDRFRMVFANEVDAAAATKAPAEYRYMPALGPVLVAAPLPDEPKARLQAMLDAMAGLDISQRPDHFQPYPHAKVQNLLASGLTKERVLALAPSDDREAWARVFDDRQGALMLPISSSRGSASVVVDGASGAILAFSPLDPWPVVNAARRAAK